MVNHIFDLLLDATLCGEHEGPYAYEVSVGTHPIDHTSDLSGVSCNVCHDIEVDVRERGMKSDPVHRPHHYNWHPSGVECIDIASAFDYALGNVIKYVWRCDYKGKPVEDLKKAQTYLARAIAEREAREN